MLRLAVHSIGVLMIAGGPLAVAAPGQSVALHFEADSITAVSGDVITWTVSASFTGYPDPTAYFQQFVGTFRGLDPRYADAQSPVGLLSEDFGTNVLFNADILGIGVQNLALFGNDDPSNPIPIYRFEAAVPLTIADNVDRSIAQLSYNAAEFSGTLRALIAPDDGVLTQPDAIEDIESTSDHVAIDVGLPGDAVFRITPSRGGYRAGDTLSWTVTVDIDANADIPFELDRIVGSLEGNADFGTITTVNPILDTDMSFTVDGNDLTGIDIDPGLPSLPSETGPIDLFSFTTLMNGDGGTAEYTMTSDVEASAAGFSIDFNETVVAIPVLFDTDFGLPLFEIESLGNPSETVFTVLSVAARDGLIAVGGFDPLSWSVVLHDATSGEARGRIRSTASVIGSALAMRNNRLIASGNENVGVYDISDPDAPVILFSSSTDSPKPLEYGSDVGFAGGLALFEGQQIFYIDKPPSLIPAFWDVLFGFDIDTGQNVLLVGDNPYSGEFPDPREPGLVGLRGNRPDGNIVLAVLRGGGDVGLMLDVSKPNAPVVDTISLEGPGGVREGLLTPTRVIVPRQFNNTNFRLDIYDRSTHELVNTIDWPDPSTSFSRGFENFDVSGDFIVVGAPRSDLILNDAGVVYLFSLSSGSLIETIRAPFPVENDRFGQHVAIDGETVVIGSQSGVWVYRPPVAPGCNPGDIAEPLGVLDLADITAFVDGFLNQLPIADLNDDSIFDLADLTVFVNSFLAGCP